MPKGKGNNNKRKKAPKPKGLLQRIKQLSVGDVAEAAFGAYNAVGALIAMNSEVKWVDTQTNGLRTYAGTVTPLSLLAQGATVNTREGESIRAHGLEFRWSVNANVTATINTARIILFQDAECRGAAPVPGDILELVGATGSTLSPWNHLGASRFNILHDSGPIGVATGGDYIKTGSIVVPLRNHVRYSGAGGTIASQYEGALYVLEMGDVVTNGPGFASYARFHYVDN